jgi:hypothetical protein
MLSTFRVAPIEVMIVIGILALILWGVVAGLKDAKPSQSLKDQVFGSLACEGFFIPRRPDEGRTQMRIPKQRYEGFFHAALALGKSDSEARITAQKAVATCKDF